MVAVTEDLWFSAGEGDGSMVVFGWSGDEEPQDQWKSYSSISPQRVL